MPFGWLFWCSNIIIIIYQKKVLWTSNAKSIKYSNSNSIVLRPPTNSPFSVSIVVQFCVVKHRFPLRLRVIESSKPRVNVVQLLGSCFGKKPIFVILESEKIVRNGEQKSIFVCHLFIEIIRRCHQLNIGDGTLLCKQSGCRRRVSY